MIAGTAELADFTQKAPPLGSEGGDGHIIFVFCNECIVEKKIVRFGGRSEWSVNCVMGDCGEIGELILLGSPEGSVPKDHLDRLEISYLEVRKEGYRPFAMVLLQVVAEEAEEGEKIVKAVLDRGSS